MTLLDSIQKSLKQQVFAGRGPLLVTFRADAGAKGTRLVLGDPRSRNISAGPQWSIERRDAVDNAVTGETESYTTGDAYTRLDNANATTITSVTASAYSGSPPLVEDRDYALAADGTAGDLLNAIEWLDTAVTLPANASTLTIDYSWRSYQPSRMLARLTTVPVFVHARDEATVHRADVAEELTRAIETWAAGQSGQPITDTSGTLEPNVYWDQPVTSPVSVESMARDEHVSRVALRFNDFRSFNEGTPARRVGVADIDATGAVV